MLPTPLGGSGEAGRSDFADAMRAKDARVRSPYGEIVRGLAADVAVHGVEGLVGSLRLVDRDVLRDLLDRA
jgi:hypothetical protein